jgi:pectinesterase
MKNSAFLIMNKYCLLILLVSSLSNALAQNKTGLTDVVDTSYTTHSAYLSTLKNYPGISVVRDEPSDTVKETRGLVYCTLGTRKLHIDAFVPNTKSVKKIPGVLIIHGGGWISGNRGQHIPLAQSLAKAGYAAFTVEYRLSGEALYPAAIYDVKAALRWMRANAQQFNIDTNKIAVLGFSAGGEMAALLGVTSKNPKFEDKICSAKFSSNVQAVVDIDGTLSFVHPESGEGDDSRSTSAATYWFGYSKKDQPALWANASPLNYAQNNKAPFLFINSSVDRMHAGRDDFRKLLNENNVYSEVHTFENSPHSFCLFNPWFEPTVKYITVFLNKVFKSSARY